MEGSVRDSFALQLAQIASEAGKIVMDVRRTAFEVSYKPDRSPVTQADKASEHAIRNALAGVMPGVPIVAEESFDGTGPATLPDVFILVDPLDGTREFVAGRDEFTVNIAVIENGVPVIGCIFAPAIGRIFLSGTQTLCADLLPGAPTPPLDKLRPVATAAPPPEGLRAIVSRSHLDAESRALLARLNVASQRLVGSSYKFCLIAEGGADVYPRLAPTMEWDVAAGHAVLAAAGGCVLARDGTPLRYGKTAQGFRDDGFVAWGRAPRPGAV